MADLEWVVAAADLVMRLGRAWLADRFDSSEHIAGHVSSSWAKRAMRR